MVRGVDPADPQRGGFWWTPGGGVEGHESTAQTAERELWEETGLRSTAGPIVLERRSQFMFDGRPFRQHETFHWFVVEEAFVPQPECLSEVEQRAITDVRWLSLTDVSGLDEPCYPRCLADLVQAVTKAGAPNPPWFEEQIEPESQ